MVDNSYSVKVEYMDKEGTVIDSNYYYLKENIINKKISGIKRSVKKYLYGCIDNIHTIQISDMVKHVIHTRSKDDVEWNIDSPKTWMYD